MKSVSRYVGKDEIIDITTALLTISSDSKAIETVVSNLPKREEHHDSNSNTGQTTVNAPTGK